MAGKSINSAAGAGKSEESKARRAAEKELEAKAAKIMQTRYKNDPEKAKKETEKFIKQYKE